MVAKELPDWTTYSRNGTEERRNLSGAGRLTAQKGRGVALRKLGSGATAEKGRKLPP